MLISFSINCKAALCRSQISIAVLIDGSNVNHMSVVFEKRKLKCDCSSKFDYSRHHDVQIDLTIPIERCEAFSIAIRRYCFN